MLRKLLLFEIATATATPSSKLPLLCQLSTSASSPAVANKDPYLALIHRITKIVRHDSSPERTLNKLNISVTSDLVSRVLRVCFLSPSESIRFFTWASARYSPTSVEFGLLIRTLSRAKKYAYVWKLIMEMKQKNKNFIISCETICSIIEDCGKRGLIDQAVEVFNKCNSLNCDQSVQVYNALLFALCEANMFDAAHALIRRMIRKGLVPDKRSYALLVNGWCSSGTLREAHDFLEGMTKKGIKLPISGRDLLIEGLLNAGYLEAAKEMVGKMTKEGIVPAIDTFNALMAVISNSGDVGICIDMYNSVCKLGLCPDINSFKILIPAVSKLERVDEAFRLLHYSIEKGHRPFPSLYAPIIKGMCRRGQVNVAFSFLSDLRVKGHLPNRPERLITMYRCGVKYACGELFGEDD